MSDEEKRIEFQPLSGRREEEEFFFQQDLEKVRQLRKKLDEQREKHRAVQEREVHWMRCPKCGSQLHEKEEGSVKVDVCDRCGGFFVDKGELELILKMNRKDSFLGRVARSVDSFFTKGFDIDRSRE